MYYTLRKAGSIDKPTYELSKWEEDRIQPLEVYVQWLPQRGDGSFKFHSCNCPSRAQECKHASISLDLLNHIKHLELYYHNGTEVQECSDIPTTLKLKELSKCLIP